MKNVFELYEEYLDAWQRIPKQPFERALDGTCLTIKCPSCGVIFARLDMEYNTSFAFGMPIFCCGKLLI